MNIDNWSIIFGYSGIKNIKNIVKVCKYFNEIIKTNKYILFLNNDDKNKLLLYALRGNKYKIIDLLICDPDIDMTYDDNIYIQVISCKEYNEYNEYNEYYEKIVKLLLNNPNVDPSTDNNYAIGMACGQCNIEMVKLLLKDSRVDPSVGLGWLSNTIVSYEGLNDNVNKLSTKIIKLLLSFDNVFIGDNFVGICRYGTINMIKLFLQYPQTDPKIDNNFALKFAFNRGDIEIIKLLLDLYTKDEIKKEFKNYIKPIYQQI